MFKCCWWLVLGWCCSTRLHSTLHRKQSQSGALEYFMALYLKYCYAAWWWCVDQSNISQFVRGPGTSSPEPSLVLGSSLVSHDGRLIATLGSFDVMLRPRLGFQCEGFILRFWLGRWWQDWQGGLLQRLVYLHHLGRRTIRVFAEFCRLFHPWCHYIGDWSREEFAISRAEVELCITPGPETSLDEDKLLIQTESSNSWTEAEHYGKDRSYRI